MFHAIPPKLSRRQSLQRLAGIGLALTSGVVTGALSGCAEPLPAPNRPPLSYSHLGQLEFDVSDLQVVSEYHAPLMRPNVEHEMPVSPQQALERWANDRIATVGASGTARFIILNASVKEVELPRTEGVKGYFTVDQSQRYEARVEVRLEVNSPYRGTNGFVTVSVNRSTTVPEDSSLRDREDTWYRLVQELMIEFDTEMEKAVRARLRGLMY
jgi:hypothetical protein